MREGILIGEGVVLDARPASFVTRFLGGLVDVAVIFAGFMLISIPLNYLPNSIDENWLVALGIFLAVLAMVLVPMTVETLTRGRSVGKLATGTRVVRDDGGPVYFRHALTRALVGVGELWMTLGSVAIIASLCNSKGKRLGDMVAGTYVIRVRGVQPTFAPLFMPSMLAGWAGQADIRRLPDGLALSARQFLGRAAGLNPDSRHRLGIELAARIEEYVAPGPPPGTHPELFLAAVLCARRDREWAASQQMQKLAGEQAALLRRLPYAVPDTRH